MVLPRRRRKCLPTVVSHYEELQLYLLEIARSSLPLLSFLSHVYAVTRWERGLAPYLLGAWVWAWWYGVEIPLLFLAAVVYLFHGLWRKMTKEEHSDQSAVEKEILRVRG
jgi:hypothetical protein